MELQNDTVINVAALLREPMGAARSLDLHLESLPLDDVLVARDFEGQIRLTRLSDDILASINGTTAVELECQRCLEPFIQPVQVKFSQEFRIAYDVRTGAGLAGETEEEDEEFEISANHELDFREPLRQEILIELPMRPSCGENCPGPPQVERGDEDESIDERFAALSALLDDE
ncbi:MAG: DUF177 domain-containing protein [Thermomicrobiales bacterium]|nr:DUF177 domain-containing protein [Thermomicrobiales bacterium]